MKTIAWLAAIGTLAMGVIYMVVSLNRWEWNRALFFGLIVLIAEVGIATALILRRLTRIETAKTLATQDGLHRRGGQPELMADVGGSPPMPLT